MPSFIETPFPVASLSAESYKERKADNGQTCSTGIVLCYRALLW